MSREACIIIIDVSSQMFKPVDTVSPMELLEPHLSSLVCQKIMDNRSGDSLGIIYVNSARTVNALAGQGGTGEGASANDEYRGIELVREPNKIEYAHLRAIKPILDCPVAHCADYVDSIVVAADLLIRLTGEKAYNKKSIILATDLSNPMPIIEMGMKEIAERLTLAGITVEVLLTKTATSNVDNTLLLEGFLRQIKGSQMCHIRPDRFPARVSGRRVRQTISFNGELSLAGGALRIPIVSYVKTMPSRSLIPGHLLWDERGQREQGRLQRSLVYVPTVEEGQGWQGTSNSGSATTTIGDDGDSGERKELAKAYRYGKTLIRLTAADEAKVTLGCEKDFSIIGFLKQHQLPQYLLMSNTHLVCSPPETAIQFGVTLQALVRACRQRSVVILVRQVLRDGATPRLVALLPHRIGDDRGDHGRDQAHDCFVMARLPFFEDVRHHAALGLEVKSRPPQLRPSEEQLDVMRQWVQSMNLPADAVDPHQTPNPIIQRQIQCILRRLASADDLVVRDLPLAAEDSCFLHDLETPEALLARSRRSLEHLRTAFSLKLVPEDRETTEVTQFRDTVSRTPAQPDIIFDQSSSLGTKQDVTCEEYPKPPGIRRIKRETLLSDFNSMAMNPYYDLVVPAMLQLMAFIPELSNTDVDLALEAIRCLRITAIREDEYKLFNTFLRDIKKSQSMASRSPSLVVLWERMQEAGLTLISSTECGDGRMGEEGCLASPDEAAEFLY